MTRQEFIDKVNDFDQLMEFAGDVGYDYENVYDSQQYDDRIYDDIHNDDNCWQEVRDWIADLPDGYEFYTQDAWGEWFGHDASDIDDLKQELLEWADDQSDVFDEEDDGSEEEEDAEMEDDQSDEFDPDSAFTIGEILRLFSAGPANEGA